MRIEIICSGDEVLGGETVNTNHAFIAQMLLRHGFRVIRETTVGDDLAALTQAFQQAAKQADVVIVNGGLGATMDDLTQEAAAKAAGVQLELHTGWLKQLEAFFHARGRPMREGNRKQAMLPQGAEMLYNPLGTACGFALSIGQAKFFFTPGVPSEMHHMMQLEVLPRLLQERTSPPLLKKQLLTFGISESHLDEKLRSLFKNISPEEAKLGLRVGMPWLEVRLYAPNGNQSLLEQLTSSVRQQLQDHILCEDGQPPAQALLANSSSTAAFQLRLAECGPYTNLAHWLQEAPSNCQLQLSLHAPHMPQLLKLLPRPKNATKSNANPCLQLVTRLLQHPVTSQDTLALALNLTLHPEHEHLQPAAKASKRGKKPDVGSTTPTPATLQIALAGHGGSWLRISSLKHFTQSLPALAAATALDSLRRHLKNLPLDTPHDFETLQSFTQQAR